MNGPLELPQVLSNKLAHFRRRVWLIKLAEGVFASLFGLALSYLIVLGLDRVIDTSAGLRTLILLAGAAVPGLGLPLKWHRWVWRQRQLEDAARLLRWKFPRLGDQLLGIVELAREDGEATGRSDRLVEAAMAQADEAVKAQDLSNAVPAARHFHWGAAALGTLALVATAFFLIQEAAGNAWARWLMPWKSIDRYTFARVQPLPNPLVVPLAEPFTLPVSLGPDARWLPDTAVGKIPDQPLVRASRGAEPNFSLDFPPQRSDARLALRVGDVRESLLVQPRARPELEELKLHLTLPDYLEYESEPTVTLRGGVARVLKGTNVEIDALISRELAKATMNQQTVRLFDDRLKSDPLYIEGDEPLTMQFQWEDVLGLHPHTTLDVQILPVDDEAPQIVARRDSLEKVVLDSEVVYFDLSASDDFGIRQLGIEWRGLADPSAPEPSTPVVTGRKISAAGAPEVRDLAARATFCALREGVPPQTIEINGWAEDYLEEREPSTSARFILHVLNKTDHALWVTSQMGKWIEAAKETYEREQQLHQTNKELRGLSAEELDRPENRRRLSQQSQAEVANGERLAAINQAGRQLIEHATKNPEFDATRLESWATLLQSLQDIAGNRMPSVADLLKESANAKADAMAQQSPGNTPSSENQSPKGGEGTPSEQVAQNSKDAPRIQEGETPPGGGASKPGAPQDPEAPAVPSISLKESTMNEATAKTPDAQGGQETPPGKPSFGLPSNSLAGAPGDPPPPPPGSSAQQALDQGVNEQRDLLAEFARVSDQLSDILASLEASTFVKRFKAAARAQLSLATGMRTQTLSAFGLTPSNDSAPDEEEAEGANASKDKEIEEPVIAYVTPHAPVAANNAKEQSEVVKVIKSDLEAYVTRRPDQHFRNVIAEMKDTEVVSQLALLSELVQDNHNGRTIHAAEFWADTFDRWAEEMVKAGACSSCSSCSGDSLPPAIVLKVMQALRDEMALRDETRELENAKPTLEQLYHAMRAGKLAQEQDRIRAHTESAIADILELPDGAQRFGKPLQLLAAVVNVMNEATDILNHLETGAPAIAAETEAIELLLQTKRQNPNGGGGGGDSPGGGGGAARASLAALSDLGPGSDGSSVVQARPIGQATGRAGREFPEEFKTGLDAYFNQLEMGRP